MKLSLLLLVSLVARICMADGLVPADEKISFVQRSVQSILKGRDPDLSVLSDSLKLAPCTGVNKLGAALSNFMQSGKGECNIVEFQVYDKKTRKMFSGRTLLSLEHTVRRDLGLVPYKSSIPQMDLVAEETKDKKTGKAVTMGIHAMNSQVIEKQTAAELFDFQPMPTAPAAQTGSK